MRGLSELYFGARIPEVLKTNVIDDFVNILMFPRTHNISLGDIYPQDILMRYSHNGPTISSPSSFSETTPRRARKLRRHRLFVDLVLDSCKVQVWKETNIQN